jgi:hypothetical protein
VACGSICASPPAAAATGCVPGGARVIARSAVATVYSVGSGGGALGVANGPTGAGGRAYGCVPGRARVAIGDLGGADRSSTFHLAGWFLAYEHTLMGVDTLTSEVVVVDLRNGRSARRFAATSPPTRPESFITVGSLAVTSAGGVAWIGQIGGIGQSTVYEVRAARAGAHADRLLDSGAQIDPATIAIAAGRVRWRAGGVARSAPLPAS